MEEAKMTMRLIVNDGDIRKLTVNPRPNTVDDLINWIKKTIEANYQFTLQYDEPEFNNAPVNLRDMSELPEKPTIRIIPIIELTTVPVFDSFSETSSQADTEILSVSSSSVEVRKEWPDPFIIPKFSVSVEYQLRQGNLAYLRDVTYLKISKEMKHCILDRLAEAIYSYKAYPDDEDIEAVATALVAEHPCLKERGSATGFQGWKNSLKFKMGNYRNDMRKLGHPDVTVNAGKRGKRNSDGEPPHKNIKKPRKGEVNYLPDLPEGMDSASLETAREAMVDEMKKKTPDVSFIKHEMNTTFALRRAEVVKDKPDISQMVQRWPALFTESQVNLEFNRITGKNLIGEFFSALDGLYPGLEEVFTKKTGRVGQQLADLRKQKKSMEPTVNRCYALRGLPILLGDNASKFFTSHKNAADDDLEIPIGIIFNGENGSPEQELNPSQVGILLEGNMVMDSVCSLPLAMGLLFGLTYALHLEYPKCMKNTFLFIQQIMLNLGRNDPPPKLQRLKNELAMCA